MGGALLLDLVRDDTGSGADSGTFSVFDRVRVAIASGSGWFTFLTLRDGLSVNCLCRSFDRFLFRPFTVYENEGPGGLNIIVRGIGRSWRHVMSSIAAALVE